MTEAEKYRDLLLRCERTFENIGKVISSLKLADDADLRKLIDAVDINTDQIRSVIIETLEL